MKDKNCYGFTSNTHNFYTPHKKLIVRDNQIFKIQKYDCDNVIFSIPQSRAVAWMDYGLSQINRMEKYSQKPLAIDVIAANSSKYLSVGCDNGSIFVRKLPDQIESPEEMNEQIVFSPQSQDQNFVNDIVHLSSRPSVIVNCYNNGSIAMWDLNQKSRIALLQKVHYNYTYKLRLQTPSILISCGADGFVVRTDMEKTKHLGSFSHHAGIWCADVVDQNCIASVGLTQKVSIWDIRCRRIVQQCRLSGRQSSFITTCNKDPMNLYFGDGRAAMKWDRRQPIGERLTITNSLVSIQGGQLLGMWERGCDIIYYIGGPQGENPPNERDLTQILNVDLKKLIKMPPTQGSLFNNIRRGIQVIFQNLHNEGMEDFGIDIEQQQDEENEEEEEVLNYEQQQIVPLRQIFAGELFHDDQFMQIYQPFQNPIDNEQQRDQGQVEAESQSYLAFSSPEQGQAPNVPKVQQNENNVMVDESEEVLDSKDYLQKDGNQSNNDKIE